MSERGKTIYRVTIKAEEGVDLDKCAQISNLISPLLDVHPPVKGEYYLEVSSPGVERKLKKASHFKNSIGENVRISTIGGEVIEGKLEKVEDKDIVVLTKNGEQRVAFDEIASAKTYFEW